MEHKVWRILNRDAYTEEGIELTKKIHDFLTNLVVTVGIENAKYLFNYWNYYSSETFRILGNLVNFKDNEKIESEVQKMQSENKAAASMTSFDKDAGVSGVGELQTIRVLLPEYYKEAAKEKTKELMHVLAVSVKQITLDTGEEALECLIAADREGIIRYLNDIKAILLDC